WSADQASGALVLSSMAISLNSLASKTSPHSLHSTTSESPSRATICTGGCLQGCVMLVLGAVSGEICGCSSDIQKVQISGNSSLGWALVKRHVSTECFGTSRVDG